MPIQTIFKAGNSSVVAIPKQLASELNLRPGQKVTIDRSTTEEALIVKRPSAPQKSMKKSDKEFQRWLKLFLKENGDILDELALR